MSEYIMSHTGEQLDEAISKVLSGYILPEGSVDITSNGEHPVSGKATAIVNVPIPDGYINLADIISHCTRSASGSYTPSSNTVMNNVSISINDGNGNSLKPKVFVLFHNSRIENSDTSTSSIAITASVTVTDDDYNLLYTHTAGIYYNSTKKACSNQSSGRYFNPISTGVQGVASDFYMQSGKEYLWYAWG